MPFIHEDFLLQTNAAKKLYHEYAAKEPILDYHSHLSSKDIADDRRFRNLFEIWLEGDHYKWRAMRANGIEEKYCTGNATPQEKFNAWAQTVPFTLRNPLFHWTHLELQRYFGVSDLLNENNANYIWDKANSLLATKDFSARAIIKRFNIQAICTTDDPCDELAYHRAIAESEDSFRVYPAFRPDRALLVNNPEVWNTWVGQLSAASNTNIAKFKDFLDALKRRHDYFHQLGGRLSDHGLNHCHASFCNEATAAAIFDRARAGRAATPEEHEQFASFMMLYFGVLDTAKGWTKQLHLGALRNANSGRLQKVGPDTGFDSIGDWNQSAAFSAYLDRLEQENALPKIVVYNVNPADNYAFATAVGNFQDESIPGKIQFGSGWWFLDQKEAIEWQLNALSNCGLLSRFIGMLTDSRSFMSFPRHEYFRRVLCNLLGNDMEKGELPNDEKLVGAMVRNICFANAKNYLGLELGHSTASREAQLVQK